MTNLDAEIAGLVAAYLALDDEGRLMARKTLESWVRIEVKHEQKPARKASHLSLVASAKR